MNPESRVKHWERRTDASGAEKGVETPIGAPAEEAPAPEHAPISPDGAQCDEDRPRMLRIDYFDETGAVCWRWIPSALELDRAKAHALRGFEAAQAQFGAVAVRIFDDKGERFYWSGES